MTFTMNHFGKSLSRQTRRAIAAMLMTGSIVSSLAATDSAAAPFDTHDSFNAVPSVLDKQSVGPVKANASQSKQKGDQVSKDYWIFSDDYCGWASAESMTETFSVNPFATEPMKARSLTHGSLQAATIVDRTLAAVHRSPVVSKQKTILESAIARAFEQLAKHEPIGLQPSTDDQKPAIRLIGSSPIIVSISEGYRPYDLTRADQIGLRMYPISIPQFRYLGGRRTMDDSLSLMGPLDCLGHGVIWTEEVSPSQSVSIKSRKTAATQTVDWFPARKALDDVGQWFADSAAKQNAAVEAGRKQLAITVIESVQPQSELRSKIEPQRLGFNAASTFIGATALANEQIASLTSSIGRTFHSNAPKTRAQELEKSVGERLLVRAGIEVDALDCATAGVADVAQKRVCCPVERYDLAAQLPSSHQLAAVGVATATLKMPHAPQVPVAEPTDNGIGEIARAEALATACDHAADMLERFALALRRAGDGVVRVAKAGANEAGSELH